LLSALPHVSGIHIILLQFSVFYRTMLYRARLCHAKSSVRPSVCPSVYDIQVPWSL